MKIMYSENTSFMEKLKNGIFLQIGNKIFQFRIIDLNDPVPSEEESK